MKVFSFRFDIDTPDCLHDGSPRLRDLAERLNVRFTFFASMGRSVSRLGVFRRMVSRGKVPTLHRAASLSARQKLGDVGYLLLAMFNPSMGCKHISLLCDLAKSQEVGLHGGRNHDTWQNGANLWSRTQLEYELDWAVASLREHNVPIQGFSSPGWMESPALVGALEARGFIYRADRHGLDQSGIRREGNGLLNLATNILGEPGGVAYLEHMRALRKSNAEIRSDFRSRLKLAGDYAVVYDHPYFAGRREIVMVEDLIQIARDEGYTVLPLAEIARIWSLRSS